jgi:hypothetical protein
VKPVEVIIFVWNDETILVGLEFAVLEIGDEWCDIPDNLETIRPVNAPKLHLIFVPWMDLDIILEEDIAVQSLSNLISAVWTCE